MCQRCASCSSKRCDGTFWLSTFRFRNPASDCLPCLAQRRWQWRVGLYPYRQHKGRKLVLGDRTEALVYILAHELRHMHQQHGCAVHSSFPVAGSRTHGAAIQKSALAVLSMAMGRRTDVRLAEAVPAAARSLGHSRGIPVLEVCSDL